MSGRALPGLAPLTRTRAGQPAFLAAHHIEAANRIQALFERGQLGARVTMHYGPRVQTSGRGQGAEPVTDMAIDARRRLNRLLAGLPADCADVVIDICGFEKGLSELETERQWPRRSAKLILRVGLDALAIQMGLSAMAKGREQSRNRLWADDQSKPTQIG